MQVTYSDFQCGYDRSALHHVSGNSNRHSDGSGEGSKGHCEGEKGDKCAFEHCGGFVVEQNYDMLTGILVLSKIDLKECVICRAAEDRMGL